jgi:hypothetical protein
MEFNKLFNLLWMQLIWFAAVLGTTHKIVWLAPVLLVIFMASVLQPGTRKRGDFQLMPIAILLGVVLDTSWINLGWLQYTDSGELAPLWILLLWASMALTINHSLAWLQSKLWAAALISGIASPISYVAAAKLGAVKVVAEDYFWLVGIGASWAVAIPFLLWLGRYLQQLPQKENEHE